MEKEKPEILVNPEKFLALTGCFRNYLDYASSAGIKGFDCSGETLAIINRWGEKRWKAGCINIDTGDSIEAIADDIAGCSLCSLQRFSKNDFIGRGSFNADIVFVGEAPGTASAGENSIFPASTGAGSLLNKMIEAMGLSVDDVYICNIMKCSPAAGCRASLTETDSCISFLERQIRAIGPQVVCTLGEAAAKSLLKSDEDIARIRGGFHNYNGIKLFPTFHPEFLIEHPEKKREAWEDIKKIMGVLNL